jgi:hypothetical protein
MKALTILLFLAFTGYGWGQQLGDFRWQYRILLLMDPYNNPDCKRQLQLLKEHSAELQERDILLFIFNGKSLHDEIGNPTPVSFREIPDLTFEGIILIGKDGGVKLKKKFFQPPAYIFERIDTMPLRRAELREGHRG